MDKRQRIVVINDNANDRVCERYHVKQLTLFGSAVKGTFDEETSDVDFLVETAMNALPPLITQHLEEVRALASSRRDGGAPRVDRRRLGG